MPEAPDVDVLAGCREELGPFVDQAGSPGKASGEAGTLARVCSANQGKY